MSQLVEKGKEGILYLAGLMAHVATTLVVYEAELRAVLVLIQILAGIMYVAWLFRKHRKFKYSKANELDE